MEQVGRFRSSHGLERLGLHNVSRVHWNYSVAELYEEAIRRYEGMLTVGGPLVVNTGDHTGRSVNDKFIVREASSEADIWWGDVNRPISQEAFAGLRLRLLAYLQGRELFALDSWAGSDPKLRLPVRVVTETAWHSLFARNMFIRPSPEELADFTPEFTIIHAPNFHAVPEVDSTNSHVFIVVNFDARLVLIGGTSYAGEIKKSVFTVLNYLLPPRDVLPMHASVNVGRDGHAALFFGLSGTGKTTLSADPERTLIGDDEHGWGEHGVFNFEGGCYAKVINLSAEAEPEIHATTQMYGTVLENVVVDSDLRVLDLDDASLTENTRASYPLSFIPNVAESGIAGHPKDIVMLTADAFGVLPPIAQLTPEQAMYHFLSGYTAKVAGTEKGLGNEPSATFSDLLRRTLHAAPSQRVRQDAGRADLPARLQLLARQHGLDERRLRRRPPHADRLYARPAESGARRGSRRDADAPRREFRLHGAGALPAGARRPDATARDLVGQRRLRRNGEEAGRPFPGELRPVRGVRRRRRQSRGAARRLSAGPGGARRTTRAAVSALSHDFAICYIERTDCVLAAFSGGRLEPWRSCRLSPS